MALEVRPVRARRDLRRFIELEWQVYRNEPRWVAPLRSERRRFLDRTRNPFFDHAEAEYLIAWRESSPVGRISAHIDHRLNEFQANAWGLFGFFECEPDPAAAAALVGAAEGWLRERGRDRMVGPMDFSTNHPCGLLVDGQERPPQILEPWQHPYYAGLLEGCGLRKAIDLLKWGQDISDRERILPVIFELAERLEPEHGITIRSLRGGELREELRRFRRVYHAAWADHWGFVPLTDAEIDDYARALRPVLDPDWALLAENRAGETVGVALAIPDYNQVLAQLDGRLLPVGWLRALNARRRIDSVRVLALGVLPEYQHTGVAAGLYVELFAVAARRPQKRAEAGWVLETNADMNRAMEAVGGRVVKRYRMYEKVFRGAG